MNLFNRKYVQLLSSSNLVVVTDRVHKVCTSRRYGLFAALDLLLSRRTHLQCQLFKMSRPSVYYILLILFTLYISENALYACYYLLFCRRREVMCFRVVGLSVRPSVRPSVNTYFAWRDISVLIGEISMERGVNIHHASGRALLKRFSRSKVKGQGHSERYQVHCFFCGGIHFDGVMGAL